MAKSKIKTLRRTLWVKYVSPYVRERDNYKCFTCGKQLDKYSSDAGHFIPKSSCSDTMYDETNVHCQCVGCNRFKHGNLMKYTLRMIEKYGIEHVKELERRRDLIKIWKLPEIEELIEDYKNKIKNAYKPN